jgi:hypothetical protein
VRQALEQGIASASEQPSCMDLTADLVGCSQGQRDLSTNPRHMDDFGR